MPRFFVPVRSEQVVLEGENATHLIKSLRAKIGEEIILCDGGTDYSCVIEAITADTATLRVLSSAPNNTEPSVDITLFQGLPKGDKMEWIIQKAVELGVTSIVPVLCRRSVSRPDKKSIQKKTERYNKIAQEACKQCGRGRLVEVRTLISFDEALKMSENFDKTVLFYEEGGEPLRTILAEPPRSAGLFIGPEGGWEESEVDAAKKSGAKIATLGRRILRTETASLAALSAILFATGNMD